MSIFCDLHIVLRVLLYPLPCMADWDSVLIVFFNSGTAILGSCANLLIIISFFVFNSSRQPTEILLINLSLADFLVCAGYQPLLVLKFKNYGVSQVYMSFIGHSVITASMTGLLAVNFDRFSAIYFPYKYITWMTEKNTISLVTISWMISLSTFRSPHISAHLPLVHQPHNRAGSPHV